MHPHQSVFDAPPQRLELRRIEFGWHFDGVPRTHCDGGTRLRDHGAVPRGIPAPAARRRPGDWQQHAAGLLRECDDAELRHAAWAARTIDRETGVESGILALCLDHLDQRPCAALAGGAARDPEAETFFDARHRLAVAAL